MASLALLAAAAAISVISGGCAPKSLVSTEDEIAVGQRAAAQVEREYKVSQDAAVNQRVTTIGQTLAAQGARPGIEYKFKVLEGKDINAFALPGGWIYVFSGLLDAVGSDNDMLAAVIGHEIGHVAARHHADIMGRSQLYGIAIAVFTKGNTQDWASFFANLNLLRWSRKHELESDRLAVKYLYQSKRYDPNGVVRLLELLKQKSGDSRFLAFLRTHPLTEDRIERAKYWVAQYEAGKGP